MSLCVEVQPRYREVRPDRWQVECPPQPDELLSSWLWRLALHNGLSPREFADALGLGGGMSWARLDAALPAEHAHVLARHTGQTEESCSRPAGRLAAGADAAAPCRCREKRLDLGAVLSGVPAVRPRPLSPPAVAVGYAAWRQRQDERLSATS